MLYVEPVLGLPDGELAEWLWRLPLCRGGSKRAPAERCARCARQAVDLLLGHHQQLLASIGEHLADYGFDPGQTLSDWVLALERIAELSEAADGDCVWSAPSHPRDSTPADALRLLDALRRHAHPDT